MELGTIEEVELIVDQIASNKIPPPNKAQVLVIIRQMMRMAKVIENQTANISELDALRNDAVLRMDTYKALCDQLGGQLTIALAYIPNNGFGYADCDAALEAWRESKCF